MPPFIPLPRFMLAGEYSINAKLLYGLLLNRTMLSQKSGWVSEDGNVYVIYTIKQMANDLDRSERTVKTALRELENAGLITRVRQGWNQANRIFLQIPDRVQVSSRPEGNICPMDVQDSSPCMGQKLPASNTDTEYIEHDLYDQIYKAEDLLQESMMKKATLESEQMSVQSMIGILSSFAAIYDRMNAAERRDLVKYLISEVIRHGQRPSFF